MYSVAELFYRASPANEGLVFATMVDLMRWVLGFLLLAKAAAAAADLTGRASIIDGDTLEIHGTRIRIFGIPDSTSTNSLTRDQLPPLRDECATKKGGSR